MRISKKPDKRRSEILETAATLFTTKGYTRTTISEIIETIGVAKGTFYYYFKSKEEVMDALVAQFIDDATKTAKSIAADPTLTAHEKMFKILVNDHEIKEGLVEEFHQIENAEMHIKSLVDTVLKLTPVLTDIVEQGIKEGVFKTSCPRESIEFLLASSQFIFDMDIFNWTPEELKQKAEAFTGVMETILGAKKGSFSYIHEKMNRYGIIEGSK